MLHTDASLLPAQRAWSAWNYESRTGELGDEPQLCVHYLINKLQPLPFKTPVIVSLNPVREPRRDTVLREFAYSHPVFDQAAVQAQRACRRCKAYATRGSRAHGPVTVSTRTA